MGTKGNIIYREEYFGYTRFDKKRMKHKFVESIEEDSNSVVLKANDDYFQNGLIYSPIRIYYELTSICNLNCKTCFNKSGKKRNDELNTLDVLKSLDGLRKSNVFDIRFSGGEVTMRKDWFDILKHSKDLGFATSLNTNGVYGKQSDVIDKLAKLGLEEICISIDGFKENHDYIRGDGNFKRTEESLKNLKSEGANLRINTVLTKISSNDLEPILDLASKYVSEINFFYMRTAGRALDILDDAVSYDELVDFDIRIEKLKKNYPELRILHGSQVMVNNSISNNLNENFGLNIGGPDGFTRLNLLPNGSIWPGGYTPHIRPDFYLGNLKENNFSLLYIWKNSEELNHFRSLSLNLQKSCGECPEKNIRCPGASMEMELYRGLDKSNDNPYCIK